MNDITRLCKIEGCVNKKRYKGFCLKHYKIHEALLDWTEEDLKNVQAAIEELIFKNQNQLAHDQSIEGQGMYQSRSFSYNRTKDKIDGLIEESEATKARRKEERQDLIEELDQKTTDYV